MTKLLNCGDMNYSQHARPLSSGNPKRRELVTLFKLIAVFCGTDNIMGIFLIILSVPQNTAMGLNNVMLG